jgi:hypothetical protein
MQFSVFTPTHRPEHLAAAYDSLVAQTCGDWEWVVVPNGPEARVDARIARDPRVRILPAPAAVAALGVGALKRYACERCRGDWFVELDHDDLLVPDALAQLAAAAQRSDAGFLYSDFANFRADGSCETFDPGYGWQSYPFACNGRDYTATRAFAVDASTLHLIFFAPNHLRAWHRDAYARAGGHDAALGVVDDHDLLCRTYLAGVPMVHVPACLYLYRLLADGRNTYLQRNLEIQQRQQQISNRYVYALIEEWCRRRGLAQLDLGAGDGCPPQYARLDADPATARARLRDGIPLPDDTVGCVRAYDVLERLPRCPDAGCDHGSGGAHGAGGERGGCVTGLMNEIHRVLAPGGWLVARVPAPGAHRAADAAQASAWSRDAFAVFTRRDLAQQVPGLRCRFQAPRIWQTYPTAWHEANDRPYVYADLVALKGQRQPGLCEI